MNSTFLEVDQEDSAKIKAAFPEATIIHERLTENEIIIRCQDAEVICCFIYSSFPASVLQKLPKLKLLITRSVGYNHIDTVAAKKLGIRVCHVPDYGAHVIAEHVFALMLTGLRNIIQGEEETNHLRFDFHGLRGIALQGKTLGVVGTGNIGAHVARIASLGFLMNVIAYDPYPNPALAKQYHFDYVDIEELWARSDIITLHCPLTESTKHLVNAKSIEQMKDGVMMINTSRGEIVETEAVLDGVKSGKIGHLALDVLEQEKDMQKNSEIMTYPNIIITPHIAFYADDAVERMYQESFATIHRFKKGEELIHGVC